MIAILTDFGLHDTYVGVLKGVIRTIHPGAEIEDISHAVPRGDIRRGAYMLKQAAPYFPRGTVFLAVVDPGVGSGRRAIGIRSDRGHYIGPDNGLFTYAGWTDVPQQTVELADSKYRLHPTSTTFHGRDIFAPAAAHLESGVPLEAFGPAVFDPVRLPVPRLDLAPEEIRGEVLHVDHFGNAATSIGILRWTGDTELSLEPWVPGPQPLAGLNARGAAVRVGDWQPIRLHRAFADVPEGELLATVNSDGHLEIDANRGSAAELMGLVPGTDVALTFERQDGLASPSAGAAHRP